ncbi:autotransporter outer membrane beta-barrel domain-containing protein [Alkalilimnicola ehrlichii]|uniref:autotransporter family protein n=1 Tax=Alkalilimnicola ehrlichii TaxID=351052 RepID=UPI0015F28852|nr:autotransporter outer membrane beta-barrel domain-containing protein [Alkalilimnicola ehrlichii]
MTNDGAHVDNAGSISGGDGGETTFTGTDNEGGVGVVVEGNSAWVTNSGEIAGGYGAGSRADAMHLNGADATLELIAGYRFLGAVRANGADATLLLGGNQDDLLDLDQLNGFSHFRKTGSSTWTLTGSGTSDVDWMIEDGTLVSAADRFSGDADIEADGTLVFDQTADATYDGVISGEGRFNIEGNFHAIVLRGDSAQFQGTTTLQNVFLTVDDTGTLGGTIEVRDNATLSGTGTVGNTRVESGGIIAPGNSIGTLTVDGDITFEVGSIYEVEADSDGNNDLLQVTGEAFLNGGSVLHIGPGGDFAPSTEYTILVADGGINGEFDAVSSEFAFLDATLRYGDTDLTMKLERNDIDFTLLTRTHNQHAAATAVASLAGGDAVHDAVVVLSEDEAPEAFEALSGDSLLAGLTTTDHLLGAFSAELRRRTSPLGARAAGGFHPSSVADTNTSDNGVWMQLHHRTYAEDRDGHTGNPEFRYQGEGLTVGLEGARGPSLLFGAALGVNQGDLRLDDRRGRGDLTGGFLGTYARYRGAGATYLRGDLSLGLTEADTERRVLGDTATSTARTHAVRLSLETGLNARLGDLDVRPYAQVAGQHLQRGSFRESGADDAGLRVARTTLTRGDVSAGLDLGQAVLLGGRWTRLQGGAAVIQGFGDTRPEQDARFLEGGDTFTVQGANHDAPQLAATLGAEVHLNDTFALHGAWSGRFSDNDTAHQATLGLSAHW